MSQTIALAGPTPPASTPPLGVLGRWGVLMARHRRIVLGIWVLLALCGAAAYPALEDRLGAPNYSVPGSASIQAENLVAEHFPQLGTEQDLLVFQSTRYVVDATEYRTAIDRALNVARQTSGVIGAVGPFQGSSALQISADRHVALGIVSLDGDMSARVATAKKIQAALAAASDADVTVLTTGFSPAQADLMQIETADLRRGEMLGIPIAMAVLVLALGAVVAATVPITVTASGIALAVGALFGLTSFLAFDSLVLSVATMIATGTAIDYAMFLVSRFAEELTRLGVSSRRDRAGIERAIGVTMTTTGRTILTAGLVVMISLCSLVVVGLPMLNGVAIGVLTAVTGTLLAAFTMLPALLATLGPVVQRGALPARLRPAEVRSEVASSAWTRWAHLVMDRPILFGTLGVAILAAAAAPLLGIRHGVDMGLDSLADRPTGQATTLVRDNFGPGLLAPIQLVATGPDDSPMSGPVGAKVNSFVGELARDPRVAQVLPQQADGRLVAVIVPAVAIDSTAATDLVTDIRSGATQLDGAETFVGGTSATFADLSERITSRLPLAIALVLVISAAFLVSAFRSIVLAVKAILLNLLATGAALGLTVVVFQHGVGSSVLGFESTGFVQIYLPMLVFAVLFGLSMDYEVFLIRRMKEYWDQDPDNTAAVAEGLRRTARPITAAAAIMVAIFASFLTADVLELKQIGFALGVAITIDAVIVRLILVPAFMKLFGRWNWWLPSFRTRKPAMSTSFDRS